MMKKKTAAEDHSASTHQTVTPEFELNTGKKTIRISTTDQKLSAHAGQATIWGFLHKVDFAAKLSGLLPHKPTSPNAGSPLGHALSFISGILAGADRLARVAWLRGDPALPELLNVKTPPSQPTLSRFFAVFDSAGRNLQCFRPLWNWSMEMLPTRKGGYTLDLDSTALLHEDGNQEGVSIGHTQKGLKPCLHPMLAVLEEAKLVAQFWLRPGNASASSNIANFFCDLWHNLPSHIRIGLVRADSGFHSDAFLCQLEALRLPYIIVADLSSRVKTLIRRDTKWQKTEIEGLEVADVIYESKYATRPRRLVIIRREIAAAEGRGGGKQLFDCPGYQFQVLVTSLPASVSALDVWRRYNGRAGIEGVIRELREGYGIAGFCLKKFYASEAALSLAVMTYNLCVLFCRRLGWLKQVRMSTLRFLLFSCAAVVSRAQGVMTFRFAVPKEHREWWKRIWEKILSEIPNCNAVDQRPPAAA